MAPPSKIRKEKLIAFSGEHLYYEIWMLYGVTERMNAGPDDDYIHNALLESFVVHASVILDFFYKPQVKPDDAKAVHYMNSIEAWNAILPSYAKYFRKFNKKRNKEVMHLSYKRLDVRPDQKRWGAFEVTANIRRLVDKFLEMADPALLDPRIYEFKSP